MTNDRGADGRASAKRRAGRRLTAFKPKDTPEAMLVAPIHRLRNLAVALALPLLFLPIYGGRVLCFEGAAGISLEPASQGRCEIHGAGKDGGSSVLQAISTTEPSCADFSLPPARVAKRGSAAFMSCVLAPAPVFAALPVCKPERRSPCIARPWGGSYPSHLRSVVFLI